MEESRAEIAERELKQMSESKSATVQKEIEQTKAVTPAEARSAGVVLIIMGIIWIIIAFVANWAVFSFGITKWGYGWVGAFWELIFLGCMLTGLYFILRGFWVIITGKD